MVRQAIIESVVSRTTANRYTNRIHRAFKWAAVNELVPASVPAPLVLLLLQLNEQVG